MKTFKKISILAILFFAILGSSCERNDDFTPADDQPEPNAFKVRMTDGPGDFEALDVEILKVEAYLQGEGWVSLNNEAQTVSVLELTNGAETTIANQADAKVQAGTYTMLKLTFGSNNSLELNESAMLELGPLAINTNGLIDLDFQGEQEVIIEIDEEVNSEAGADILLDFQVAQSIYQEADEFFIQPVIEEIEDPETGVTGEVTGSATAMVLLASDNDTLSTMINAEGEFLLRGMGEGIYDLLIFPGQEVDMEEPEPIEIEGLVVTEGEVTTVGNISF